MLVTGGPVPRVEGGGPRGTPYESYFSPGLVTVQNSVALSRVVGVCRVPKVW